MNASSQMLILVSSDWMMQPRVQAAAQRNGWECRAVLSLAQLDSVDLDPVPDYVLILADLPAAASLNDQTLSELRARFPNARVVVFGPHVQQSGLDRAASVGCDAVWTNGQLQRAIESGRFPCVEELWGAA